MKLHRPTLLLGELHESFSMAMNAVTAHKLRSALTLLGVLIGVFSIIVVMTAMRVLQSRIEAQISSLGSQTFMIRKWPAIFFTLPEGIEKIRRRKNITLQQGLRFQEKITLAQSVGIQAYFWAGEIQTAHAKTAPDVQMLGETPAAFPRATGPCPTGGFWRTRTCRACAMSACWATPWPPTFSRRSRPLASD